MSLITTLTRTWLTRTLKPFTFLNEYDRVLPYGDLDRLGLYIHIPFCRSICAFCPYCKVLYDAEKMNRYIDALIREIHLVGETYAGKKEVTSLYFGGGTPALAADRLPEILDAVRAHFVITEGIGLELHPDNVTVPVLTKLRDAGVTKISIGIQSFQPKYQEVLGRTLSHAAGGDFGPEAGSPDTSRRGEDCPDRHADASPAPFSRGESPADRLAAALEAVPFETVSMDFIFALPGQTYEDLKADIETAFTHGANHIAIYPYIDFTFTKSTVPVMPKKEKKALLDRITAWCASQGYVRNTIWTFAKEPEAGYSSMTRENFLGFGCSATTLLRDQFKINTFSIDEYCRRIGEGTLPTCLTTRFVKRQRMVYYLFWTAYSTRVDPKDFEAFFGGPLKKLYGFELWLVKALGCAVEKDGVYEMTPKGAFYYHYYEQYYTLAYIDKMWGILRKEAFPERIEL
ncbi:MAG: radical SAM protein [Lachnospiraceae bacterium]|nr:radical SAM protein [Lachnospiraceae bacterium]